MTTTKQPPTKASWQKVIKSAFDLFQDLEERGFGTPPFSLGGGTVLMFRFQHRLSKDIDFFGYEAQWISLLSPRLNEHAAAIAIDYLEQANGIKIVMPHGDIDFVVSADVVQNIKRKVIKIQNRSVELDPTSEILAKKMFYRASHFKARDVYDMSAAIDIDPLSAHIAVLASKSRSETLLKRLHHLSTIDSDILTDGIIPFDSSLTHADNMIAKVYDFVFKEREEPNVTKYKITQTKQTIRKKESEGPER